MKKKLLLAFVLFFSITLSDIGIAQIKSRRVTLTDIYGNKYTFTIDSVFCGPDLGKYMGSSNGREETIFGIKNCTGSAIKTDIAGNRYAEEFDARCSTSVNTLLCVAAVKLGHF